MASFGAISALSGLVLDKVHTWDGIAGQLAALVLTPVLVGASIMVIWHGITILRGAGGGNHILDIFVKLLRIVFVLGLAISAGAYTSNVVGFFLDLREGLTAMFIPGSGDSYAALDNAMSKALESWDPMWNHASINISLLPPNFAGVVEMFCWFSMVLAFAVFAAICAFNLLLIDLSLAIIFALGPIFIACFAFQATSKFTDAWISGVLKYTFTAIVIAAVAGLGIEILTKFVTALASAGDNLDYVAAFLSAIASSIIMSVLTLRVPAIAGDIVGGIGIHASIPRFGLPPGAVPGSAPPPSNVSPPGTGIITGGNSGGNSLGQSAAASPSFSSPPAPTAPAAAMTRPVGSVHTP